MTAEVQTSFARGGTKSSAEARHRGAPRCFTHRGPRVSRRRWTSPTPRTASASRTDRSRIVAEYDEFIIFVAFRAAAHGEALAATLTVCAACRSQRRVEYGHCPDIPKIFGYQERRV